MKKLTKIPATFEEARQIKAENRAKKIELIASLSKEERAAMEEWLHDYAVKNFGGYRSRDRD